MGSLGLVGGRRVWRLVIFFLGSGGGVWGCFGVCLEVWRCFWGCFVSGLVLNSPWVATELLLGGLPGVGVEYGV